MRIAAKPYRLFFILAVLAGATGCESIFGFKTFSDRPSEADASADGSVSPPASDAAVETSTSPGTPETGLADDGAADAGPDGEDASDAEFLPEIAPPPPPPAVGKPGMDVTAGGNVSKTSRYTLIATVGEAPGGNVVSKSSMYTLKAGVVAATQ